MFKLCNSIKLKSFLKITFFLNTRFQTLLEFFVVGLVYLINPVILFQIQKVVIALGDYMNAQCHACIGGTNVREDIRKLEMGVHVVVGTPGRVFDMISRKALRKYYPFFYHIVLYPLPHTPQLWRDSYTNLKPWNKKSLNVFILTKKHIFFNSIIIRTKEYSYLVILYAV